MKKDKFDPFKELLEKLKQNQIEIKTAEKDKQNQNTDLEIKNAKVKAPNAVALGALAPPVRLEPTTLRLTAACSTD